MRKIDLAYLGSHYESSRESLWHNLYVRCGVVWEMMSRSSIYTILKQSGKSLWNHVVIRSGIIEPIAVSTIDESFHGLLVLVLK